MNEDYTQTILTCFTLSVYEASHWQIKTFDLISFLLKNIIVFKKRALKILQFNKAFYFH